MNVNEWMQCIEITLSNLATDPKCLYLMTWARDSTINDPPETFCNYNQMQMAHQHIVLKYT